MKLQQRKIKNAFLAKLKYTSNAYLSPADLKQVTPHMDKLLKAIAVYAKK